LRVYYNVDMLAEWAADIAEQDRNKAIRLIKVAKRILCKNTRLSAIEVDEYVMRRYKSERFLNGFTQ